MSGAASARRILTFTAYLIQAVAAIVMIFYIGKWLANVDVDAQNRQVDVQCALDKEPTKDSLCKFGYIGIAITFAALFGLSLLMCLTCDCCGGPLGSIVGFITYTVLCVGWVMYASWVTNSVRAIDNWETKPAWDTDKVENARTVVWGLSWLQAAMFGLLAAVTLLTGCCCPDNPKRK